MDGASIEFQAQNGTAAGVKPLCHHLPQGAVSRDARLEYLRLVNRFPPKPAQTCFCGRWRSANECVRIELALKSVLIAICVSRSFFCDLSQESIDAFNKIKHAAVFPEHAVVLVEG